MIKVKLKRSVIGKTKDVRATVRSLGFKRIGQVLELDDKKKEIDGMIKKVFHMVEVIK